MRVDEEVHLGVVWGGHAVILLWETMSNATLYSTIVVESSQLTVGLSLIVLHIAKVRCLEGLNLGCWNGKGKLWGSEHSLYKEIPSSSCPTGVAPHQMGTMMHCKIITL